MHSERKNSNDNDNKQSYKIPKKSILPSFISVHSSSNIMKNSNIIDAITQDFKFYDLLSNFMKIFNFAL